MYLSVVIPIKDEEESVKELYTELVGVLKNLNKNYEIIITDDGSSDGTFSVLKELQAKDPHLKVISFRKNFGQTAAMAAGFDYAIGEIIVTMDGDMQNDPADIPRLLEKIEEGYDLVSGWRYDRKDKFWTRRFPSKVANWLISRITGVKLHDYGCSLKAFKHEVIKNIALYGELHRFIPAVAALMGVTEAELKVNHRYRTKGKSKYGLSRIVRVFLDLITVKFLLSYSTKPIQIFGFFGLISGFIGSAGVALVIIQRQFFGMSADRPLLLLAILMIFTGFQFITLGLIAEIQIRTYHESQEKPIYAVKEVLDSQSPAEKQEDNEVLI